MAEHLKGGGENWEHNLRSMGSIFSGLGGERKGGEWSTMKPWSGPVQVVASHPHREFDRKLKKTMGGQRGVCRQGRGGGNRFVAETGPLEEKKRGGRWGVGARTSF